MNYFTRILIVTATLLTGIAVVIFAVAVPSVRAIVELRGKIEQERVRLEVAAAKAAAYRGSASRLAEVNAQLPPLEKAFLARGGEVQFFTALEKLARTNSVSSTISVGQDQTVKEVRALPLDLKLQGTFLNFFRYMLGLERLDTLTAFRTISVSADPTKTTKESPSLNVTLNGNIYGQD